MCPDLFATLPNVSDDENLKIFTDHCWYCLLGGNVRFKSKHHYLVVIKITELQGIAF